MRDYGGNRVVKRTIWVYQAILVMRNFGANFFLPIYAIFLKDKGLDYFQINLVNAMYFSLSFFLELPTGALADLWGRKKCVVASCAVLAVAMLTYASATELWQFVVAEALAAIGGTLCAGAFYAWLTTRLNHLGATEKPSQIQMSTFVTMGVTGVIASLIGGRLAGISYWWPWTLAGITFIITCVCAWLWIEEDHDYEVCTLPERIRALGDKIKEGGQYAATHPTIKVILLMTLLLSLAVQAPNMQWGPFFRGLFHANNIGNINSFSLPEQAKLETSWVSYIWTGMMLMLALGGKIGQMIEPKIKDEKWALLGSLVFTGIGIALAPRMGAFGLTVAVFITHEAARGLYKPLCDGYLNKQVTDEAKRATVLSVGSLPMHLASVTGLALSGFIAQKTSVPTAWLVSGLGLVIVTISLIIWSRRKERETT